MDSPMQHPPAPAGAPSDQFIRFFRIASLSMSAIFMIVGLVFLTIPGHVLAFFNQLSAPLGLSETPVQGDRFYLILAVAYMYLVSLLAWRMFRHPDDRSAAILLANAKGASAILSLGVFIFLHPFLILLANGVIDGTLALFVVWLGVRMTRATS